MEKHTYILDAITPIHLPTQTMAEGGIKMCESWRVSFESFWNDMKEGYADDLEIDRIDYNGDYCPENCQWASDKQQNRNKRNNHYLHTSLGLLTTADLAELTGLPYSTVKARVK